MHIVWKIIIAELVGLLRRYLGADLAERIGRKLTMAVAEMQPAIITSPVIVKSEMQRLLKGTYISMKSPLLMVMLQSLSQAIPEEVIQSVWDKLLDNKFVEGAYANFPRHEIAVNREWAGPFKEPYNLQAVLQLGAEIGSLTI